MLETMLLQGLWPKSPRTSVYFCAPDRTQSPGASGSRPGFTKVRFPRPIGHINSPCLVGSGVARSAESAQVREESAFVAWRGMEYGRVGGGAIH